MHFFVVFPKINFKYLKNYDIYNILISNLEEGLQNMKSNHRKIICSVLSLVILLGVGYCIYKNLPKIFVAEAEDVRNKDLSRCTIKDQKVLRSLFFNQSTIWPDSSKLPSDLTPEELMESAKYPGMQIKDLHDKEITGKNVHVAIIDQCMGKALDHPEYKDAIAEFKTFFPEEIVNSDDYSGTSFHGSFVTGLLAGKNTGIAPDVKLHYIEVPIFGDAKYFADALNYIIDKNQNVPDAEKIRIVSVSSAPSATAGITMKNGELWESAMKRAKENNILVLDTLESIQSCYLDYKNVDDVTKCFLSERTVKSLKDNEEKFLSTLRSCDSIYDLICVPCGCRTFPEVQSPGIYSYAYQCPSQSGSVPVLSGILALGMQVRSEISNDDLIQILYDTSHKNSEGFRIVYPLSFVQNLIAH